MTGPLGSSLTVPTECQTAAVTMRAPLRKYSSKRTASYRWSGTEMLQLEGERTDCASPVPLTPEVKRIDLEATRENIAYKKTCAALAKKMARLGFTESPTWSKEHARTGDNCLRALIDQICQPQQDFKVWDRDDHGFLRWYLAKQVEIQVAGGRASHFLRGETENNPSEFVSKISKDGEFMNNDFLYSTARILNKDIYVVESSGSNEEVSVFRGGVGGAKGKGSPLLLAHLSSEDAGGKDYYQSVTVNEGMDPSALLASLNCTEQSSSL